MSDTTFPNHDYSPLMLQKKSNIPLISLDIHRELFLPFFSVLVRAGRVFAPNMSMPETTMHKNGSPVLRQYNIRLSRKLPVMQPVPKTGSMQKPSDDQFGLSVLAPYSSHHS